MTTLDPALDKLRNKELSFGCIIVDLCGRDNDYEQCKFVTDKTPDYGGSKYLYVNSMGEVVFIEGIFKEDENRKIVGHPLTLGRIWKLGYDKFTGVGGNIINTMQCIMNDVYTMGLADQTEIERQQHPKRPELRELLIKFAEYI